MPYTTFKYVYPSILERQKLHSEADLLIDKPLSYTIYDRALVLPADYTSKLKNRLGGGCKTADNKAIRQTSIENAEAEMYEVSQLFDMTDDDIEYRDEDVIFVSFLFHVYGHGITDCIKLAWFMWSEYIEKFKDRKPILVSVDNHIFGYERELFDLMGLNIDEIEMIRKPTRFRSVLVPDESFRHEFNDSPIGRNLKYSREYLETVDRIIAEALRRCPAKNYPKVYFSRTPRDERRSRKLIDKTLKKEGYKIVVPVKLSLAEQISYLQGCKVFMVTDGSIAHNAIFLREGTEYAILRKCPVVNWYTTIIIAAKKLNTTIIDCHLSSISAGYKPFFYYVNKHLCDYLGIERQPFPFGTFSRYWRHLCIYENIADRLLVSEDYRNILQDEILYTEQILEAKLRKLIPFKGAKWEKVRKMMVYAVMYLKLM